MTLQRLKVTLDESEGNRVILGDSVETQGDFGGFWVTLDKYGRLWLALCDSVET